MKIGDIVARVPKTFWEWSPEGDNKGSKGRALEGRVVYIHPRGRYHTVEFQLAGGPVLESFWGS